MKNTKIEAGKYYKIKFQPHTKILYTYDHIKSVGITSFISDYIHLKTHRFFKNQPAETWRITEAEEITEKEWNKKRLICII